MHKKLLIGIIIVAILIAGGYFLLLNRVVPVVRNQGNSLATTTVSSIDTSNWKTYSSYSVEFQYPNDWSMEPIIGHQYFQDTYSLITFYDKEGKSVLGLNIPSREVGYEDSDLIKTEVINVQGKPITKLLYKIVNDIPPAYFMLIHWFSDSKWSDKDGGGPIKVEFSVSLSGPNDPFLVTLDRIISTLKFTNSFVDTSNWKTYKNDKYGFEFKYPNGSTIKDNVSNIVVNLQDSWVQIWTEDQGRGWFEGQILTGQKQVIVDDVESTLFNYGADSYLYIDHEGRRYVFIAENKSLKNLFTGILSTFKFTK